MNLFKNNTPSFTDQIYVAEKQLTPEFCKTCIAKFEDDPCRHVGETSGGHMIELKQSDDLMISRLNRWNEVDSQISIALSRNVNNFIKSMKSKFTWWDNPSGIHDTGYQMQRTVPNGFYNWHHDFCTGRWYTFIFYLNDVKEKGYTEFIDGTRIQPKVGKCLLFPATTVYRHRGVSPVNEIKYLITGWLYTEFDGDTKVQGKWQDLIKEEVIQKEKDFNYALENLPENRFGAEDSHITMQLDEFIAPDDPQNNVQMIIE